MQIELDDLPLYLRMKILRVITGVSARTTATRWGKSQAYVYRVERGEADPTPLEIRDAHDHAATAYAKAVTKALEAVASGAHSDQTDPAPARTNTVSQASARDKKRGAKGQQPESPLHRRGV